MRIVVGEHTRKICEHGHYFTRNQETKELNQVNIPPIPGTFPPPIFASPPSRFSKFTSPPSALEDPRTDQSSLFCFSQPRARSLPSSDPDQIHFFNFLFCLVSKRVMLNPVNPKKFTDVEIATKPQVTPVVVADNDTFGAAQDFLTKNPGKKGTTSLHLPKDELATFLRCSIPR